MSGNAASAQQISVRTVCGEGRMESEQYQALRGLALEAGAIVSRNRFGFKVEIDGLSLLELQELLAAARKARGAA